MSDDTSYYVVDSIHDGQDQWREVTYDQFVQNLQENLDRQEREKQESGAA